MDFLSATQQCVVLVWKHEQHHEKMRKAKILGTEIVQLNLPTSPVIIFLGIE